MRFFSPPILQQNHILNEELHNQDQIVKDKIVIYSLIYLFFISVYSTYWYSVMHMV